MVRKTMTVLAVGVLALPLLAACESSLGYKQPAGALLGGAAGGLLGSKVGGGKGQLAATAGGALLGAILGGETGRSLDKADAAYARPSYAAPAQVPVAPPSAVPYYRRAPAAVSPAPPASLGRSAAAGPRGCQPLAAAPGQPVSYACQATDGSWFIVR